MSVETAGAAVSYALFMRREQVLFQRRWRYQLVRAEGAAMELIVSGQGPKVRSAIGLYLQDVRALGGPDAAAAEAAIRAGWMTQVCP